MRGGGGLRLHVREWGRPDGPPIVFIHGGRRTTSAGNQYDSALADEFRLVAFDLRGHGMSEAPLEPEHYTNGRLWADDLAAVIDGLAPRPRGPGRVVLRGFLICDYVRSHGQDRIAAINFVEGAVKLGASAFGTLIGPGFLDHFVEATADDLPTNIRAMRSFVGPAVRPVPVEEIEMSLCWDIVVPARIRANLASREIDGDDVLRGLGCRAGHPGAGARSCCRPWPNTSWPPARPPRPPGTTGWVTCRSWRTPSASTASWPSSRGECGPDPCGLAHGGRTGRTPARCRPVLVRGEPP